MILKSKLLGLVAGITVAGALSASAGIIDFTKSTALSGTINGTTWDLTGGPGALNFTPFDGKDVPVTPLALTYDGVGIGDDEVTNGREKATVTFGSAVKVTGFYFLDIFKSKVRPGDAESAIITDQLGALVGEFFGDTFTIKKGSGYLFVQLKKAVEVTALTFVAGAVNDDDGKPDFALAGIAAVPLPAGGLLLLSGLGAMAAARRRKV